MEQRTTVFRFEQAIRVLTDAESTIFPTLFLFRVMSEKDSTLHQLQDSRVVIEFNRVPAFYRFPSGLSPESDLRGKQCF